MENLYSEAGTAAGSGETGKYWAYQGLGAGQILLSASAGWTGGGGASAKGVKASEVLWYEAGSQTIKGTVFNEIKDMTKVAAGKKLVSDYGIWELIFKRGDLKPAVSDIIKGLKEGPTPFGYIGLQSARVAGPPLADRYLDQLGNPSLLDIWNDLKKVMTSVDCVDLQYNKVPVPPPAGWHVDKPRE